MSEDVAIIVPCYGDWGVFDSRTLRAIKSAEQQSVGVREIGAYHRDTLAAARNDGANDTDAEWLIFLDADDELDPHYVEEMMKGTAQLRQPATLGVYDDGREDPFSVNIPPRVSIRQANWFVIGTMIHHDLFNETGGFWDEPAWEDWSLMLRCFALGATWEPMKDAVYKVHVHPAKSGRNNSAEDNRGLFHQILQANDQWAQTRGLVIR